MSESGAWYDTIRTPEQQLAAQPHLTGYTPRLLEASTCDGPPKPLSQTDNRISAPAVCANPPGKTLWPCIDGLHTALKDVDGYGGGMLKLAGLQDRKDGIRKEMTALVGNKSIAAGGPVYNNMLGQIETFTNQQENQVAARYQLAVEVSQSQSKHPNLGLQTWELLRDAGDMQKRIDTGDNKGFLTPWQVAIQGAMEQQARGAIDERTVIPEGLVHAAIAQLSAIPGWTREGDRQQAQSMLRAAYRMDPTATETALRLQTESSFRPGLAGTLGTILGQVKSDYENEIVVRSQWLN